MRVEVEGSKFKYIHLKVRSKEGGHRLLIQLFCHVIMPREKSEEEG